jgi:hypothetical protein
MSDKPKSAEQFLVEVTSQLQLRAIENTNKALDAARDSINTLMAIASTRPTKAARAAMEAIQERYPALVNRVREERLLAQSRNLADFLRDKEHGQEAANASGEFSGLVKAFQIIGGVSSELSALNHELHTELMNAIREDQETSIQSSERTHRIDRMRREYDTRNAAISIVQTLFNKIHEAADAAKARLDAIWNDDEAVPPPDLDKRRT